MSEKPTIDFADLYTRFQAPIATLDCGKKCAPYNENGVPFCCDIHHAVPTAYQEEWVYLRSHTDLWHPWNPENPAEEQRLQNQAPRGLVLIACLGHMLCQRNFRSITCRSFPFFPYLTRQGDFIGITYYWEYEDRCWVISHLNVLTAEYLAEFIAAYDVLFEKMPQEREEFRHHSTQMRRIFGRKRRAIPLVHRNGKFYKVTPHNGRMRLVSPQRLSKFGPYRVAAQLPFPDEI